MIVGEREKKRDVSEKPCCWAMVLKVCFVAGNLAMRICPGLFSSLLFWLSRRKQSSGWGRVHCISKAVAAKGTKKKKGSQVLY